jgi:hypothetical protein
MIVHAVRRTSPADSIFLHWCEGARERSVEPSISALDAYHEKFLLDM